MFNKRSFGDVLFDYINYIVLGIISIVTVLPFIHVIIASFTPPEYLVRNSFVLFPSRFSLESYRYVFSTNVIAKSLLVSVGITVAGTLFNIIMAVVMAYPLAHKRLVGRKVLMLMVTFTLMFNGGMVPTFIIIQKLHLMDSYWSLILPGAISAFNLIIFKSYFQDLPAELEESAKIDGYNDLRILISIIMPISKPLMATFVVLFGVGHWNSWFGAILYLNDSQKWPVQVVLRQIITASSQIGESDLIGQSSMVPAVSVEMCAIAIATMPILCVYPFLQKYFTKGLLLGSVKG